MELQRTQPINSIQLRTSPQAVPLSKKRWSSFRFHGKLYQKSEWEKAKTNIQIQKRCTSCCANQAWESRKRQLSRFWCWERTHFESQSHQKTEKKAVHHSENPANHKTKTILYGFVLDLPHGSRFRYPQTCIGLHPLKQHRPNNICSSRLWLPQLQQGSDWTSKPTTRRFQSRCEVLCENWDSVRSSVILSDFIICGNSFFN